MTKNLGRIKEVSLRELFIDEAKNFTPWLEKNINELAEAVGIEIEDVKKEKDIGNFSADLIGVESNSENSVIIENQLESTDHDHLGKLMTYASGIGAKYVIWIAKKIRDEHQKALEWLNENMGNEIAFFGVEVGAIKIDDSLPAVNFRVMVEPNTWGREIKQKSQQIDERHQRYLEIFTRIVAEYEKSKPEWSHLTPRADSWLAFGAGRAGFTLTWAFRGDNKFDTELYIDTRDKDEVKLFFAELQNFSSEVNKRIPNLSWEELPDKRGSRIAVYYKMPTSVKKLSDNQIDLLVKWAIEQMDLFKKVFPEFIRKLTN